MLPILDLSVAWQHLQPVKLGVDTHEGVLIRVAHSIGTFIRSGPKEPNLT